ncbi:MAG: shikimate kinase [Prevotellaceae bacterium]|jgi:shikimate kinase|nr:shikimate kinase [Prevotellaceae bacterium]
MNSKKHVILTGMPGSGKSSVGFYLSKLMQRPFIDTDHYISARENKSITQIFSEYGEDCFRGMERQALLEIIENRPSVISTGGGMPCFYDNMDVMNKAAITVYLETSPEKLFEYLKNDKKRPLVKDKTYEELMDYINDSLIQRKPYYEKADMRVRAHEKTSMQLAKELYETIEELRTKS